MVWGDKKLLAGVLREIREIPAHGTRRWNADNFRDIRPPERADYELTPHETRLLKLLVEGHNYKTAASELNVSVNTVSFHMRHIYEKLQVHSKSEAVAKALRDRLVS